MRGLPGSGKSTRVHELMMSNCVDNSVYEDHVFSADNYWIRGFDAVGSMSKDEFYKSNFDATKLFLAHQWNNSRIETAIKTGVSPIIFDNTNVRKRDYRFLIDHSHTFQYEVEICEPTSPWWIEYRPYIKSKDEEKLKEFAKILANKNVHGCPEEVIFKGLMKWQEND